MCSRYRKSEPTNVGRLDESSCPYTLHPSQDAARQVRCGLLVVPQDRRDPAGPVVRVPYAAFKSPQPSELAPVVYLAGGPGQTWFPSDPADWRDVLGTAVADVTECAASVSATGARTEGFNSDELAADVADLVRLLGYDKVVLNGVSYGALWAFAVMRDHPERVESAVLDSVLQQSQPAIAFQMPGLQSALQGADKACAKEPPCAGRWARACWCAPKRWCRNSRPGRCRGAPGPVDASPRARPSPS